MNSPEACRKRLLKYLIPVVVFSLVFNIPKFLEARLDTVSLGPDEDTNTTRLEVIYNVTSLRLNPDYMYYYIHWTRSQYPISVSIQIKMSNILLFFNVSSE